MRELRCFCCQEHGRVAAVRRGVRRFETCGKNKKCEREESEEEQEQGKCIHCDGKHHAGSAQCQEKE